MFAAAPPLPAWAQAELAYPGALGVGAKDNPTSSDPANRSGVRRVQEWLTLAGVNVLVDGDFGPATLRALRAYAAGIEPTPPNALTPAVWSALTRPMARALDIRPLLAPVPGAPPEPLGNAVRRVALTHLKAHPREVGGANRGPWVRLYCKGHDGAAYAWCAGFVSFVVQQAAALVGVAPPLVYTLSCDALAADASKKGLLLSGSAVASGQIAPPSASLAHGAARSGTRSETGGCGVFLVRNPKNAKDWTHTGLAYDFERGKGGKGVVSFLTVEGNSNDEGSREGYEVCARARGMTSVDFIRLSP